MNIVSARTLMIAFVSVALVLGFARQGTIAQPLPGGTLDPTTIPKYVTPLVIPPVMNNDGTADSYDIAVRQFQQQILPGGHWNTASPDCASSPGLCNLPSTTVWSYGPATDPAPDSSAIPGGAAGLAPAPNSQFNYPAYTVETTSNGDVDVRWINDLLDKNGKFLPHLLPIDQTVHWANPPQECRMGLPRTDCSGTDPTPYKGPVPIVTHVHGAHVDGHSDGYPEAWWLPAATNIPKGYATEGTLFDDAFGQNPSNSGYADYSYRQDQPATTLWYHDHTLGMTRNNVYAGPAGFWLIRDGAYDLPACGSGGLNTTVPCPAPTTETVLELNLPGPERYAIREIPIVIQDRSFNKDGSLFYPDNRAFFEGVKPSKLKIDFAPENDSDVLPIWLPEAFFNVMVVNGVSWPELEVAPALYRLRLLNGCNSRFLWLKFDTAAVDVYQIGAEQGFLPAPISMKNNLDGSGDGRAQILMALAERADVIVDFRGLGHGTVINLQNIGPDEPFGGGIPGIDFPKADPGTTGQVMRFVVNATLAQDGGPLGASPTDPVLANGDPNPNQATSPASLVLPHEAPLGPTTGPTRRVSLNERESEVVCVEAVFDPAEGELVPDFPITQIKGVLPGPDCDAAGGIPFGPTEALLGTVICVDDATGAITEDPFTPPDCPAGSSLDGKGLKWTDDTAGTTINITLENGNVVPVTVTENPTAGNIEDWEIYNFTADAHPIHLHLVRFQVLSRAAIPGFDPVLPVVQPWEDGFKDTFISYPGEITKIRSLFDVAGLYVWHCHIVEHEDNEMMRPYIVSAAGP